MKHSHFALPLLSLLAAGSASSPASRTEPTNTPQPVVRIHYLGHASFLLQFDNGVSVLTDYGQSKAYGLDSPIYDWTGAEPDVVTFSHAHPDHKRPGAEFAQAHVLTGTEAFGIQGLEIKPIQTGESSIYAPDNSSFLFTYKGLKILHLADAQAYIMGIEEETVRQKARYIYPERYDLLLMTIEGINKFIPQAEKFIDLLRPVRVIPMHYWSPEYKADFLAYLETQNKQAGKSYDIVPGNGADFELYAAEEAAPVQVISLDPAAWRPAK